MTYIPTLLSGPKISESDIEEFENHIAKPLPFDYRSFLLQYNGGMSETSKRLFVMETEGDNLSVIDMFYGINHSDLEYRLKWNYDDFSSRMPPKFLPIGHDPYGNRVCLSLNENDYGWVYFWDHEREQDIPDYSNCYKIAESFTQFIESLQEIPELDSEE